MSSPIESSRNWLNTVSNLNKARNYMLQDDANPIKRTGKKNIADDTFKKINIHLTRIHLDALNNTTLASNYKGLITRVRKNLKKMGASDSQLKLTKIDKIVEEIGIVEKHYYRKQSLSQKLQKHPAFVGPNTIAKTGTIHEFLQVQIDKGSDFAIAFRNSTAVSNPDFFTINTKFRGDKTLYSLRIVATENGYEAFDLLGKPTQPKPLLGNPYESINALITGCFEFYQQQIKINSKEKEIESLWSSLLQMNKDHSQMIENHKFTLDRLEDKVGEVALGVDEEEYNPFAVLEALSRPFSELPSTWYKAMVNKNRYPDIICPDLTRATTGIPLIDYIQANHVWVGGLHCIAAQGPLPKTLIDHFSMILHNKVPTQIRLTKAVEGGNKKCHNYWDSPKDYDLGNGYEVTVTAIENGESQLIYRKKGSKQIQHVCTMLHFNAWPDHGVPKPGTGFNRFIDLLKRTDQLMGDNPQNPTCVHCSAGVGRTSTFIEALSVIRRIRKQQASTFNITKDVVKMRFQRPGAIQSPEQLLLIYRAVKAYVDNPW